MSKPQWTKHQHGAIIMSAWKAVLVADDRLQRARDAFNEAQDASNAAWEKYEEAKLDAMGKGLKP